METEMEMRAVHGPSRGSPMAPGNRRWRISLLVAALSVMAVAAYSLVADEALTDESVSFRSRVLGTMDVRHSSNALLAQHWSRLRDWDPATPDSVVCDADADVVFAIDGARMSRSTIRDVYRDQRFLACDELNCDCEVVLERSVDVLNFILASSLRRGRIACAREAVHALIWTRVAFSRCHANWVSILYPTMRIIDSRGETEFCALVSRDIDEYVCSSLVARCVAAMATYHGSRLEGWVSNGLPAILEKRWPQLEGFSPALSVFYLQPNRSMNEFSRRSSSVIQLLESQRSVTGVLYENRRFRGFPVVGARNAVGYWLVQAELYSMLGEIQGLLEDLSVLSLFSARLRARGRSGRPSQVVFMNLLSGRQESIDDKDFLDWVMGDDFLEDCERAESLRGIPELRTRLFGPQVKESRR